MLESLATRAALAGRARRVGLAALALCLLAPDHGGYERPADPLFPWQWSLENVGQPIERDSSRRGIPDADIDAVEAFAAGHTGEGIVIALIGLGLAYEPGPLQSVLWRNPREVPGNGIDDDGNQLVDDVVGYDFAGGDPVPYSASEHDLKVAEIAVAPHDRVLTAGIAPGARLMILRIADDRDRILTGPLRSAVIYAVRNGARILLLPWTHKGSSCYDAQLAPHSTLLKQASRHALIIGGHPGSWPACLPEVVSIRATDPLDRPRGEPSADVDFAAPGSDGRVPVATSYAIGVVGGAAALLWAQNPGWSPNAVRGRLMLTADKIHPNMAPYVGGRNDLFGAGRINVARALGTDFDGDGIVDPDDADADGDGILDLRDPCTLEPDPDCSSLPRAEQPLVKPQGWSDAEPPAPVKKLPSSQQRGTEAGKL